MANIAREFIQCCIVAEDVTRNDHTAAKWHEPSALQGYDVGALAGHLARAIFTAERYATEAPATQTNDTNAAHYFAIVLGDEDPVHSSLHRQIRSRGASEAFNGAEDLARRIHSSRACLARLLSADDVLDRPVEVRDGLAMTLGEYLKSRLVELVVHIDDLATSVGLQEAPSVPQASYQITAGVLAELAAIRKGGLMTVRSLAREERNPEPVRAL